MKEPEKKLLITKKLKGDDGHKLFLSELRMKQLRDWMRLPKRLIDLEMI